ncbi:MAG TPA: hypothetical protein VFE47_09860 [Tepidisphaeraceae bacterium]|jgi:hypothetical protein|nr:hypothetical protein [Tepidisphaeraceae bacterium]
MARYINLKNALSSERSDNPHGEALGFVLISIRVRIERCGVPQLTGGPPVPRVSR